MSVQRFCEQQGLTEQSFYVWRKRLRKQSAMRFTLVETGAGRQPAANGPVLELVRTTGERLRIGGGVDAAVFRAVLETLRGDALAGKCAGVSMPDTLRHAQEL
jgi:hypothetical protein